MKLVSDCKTTRECDQNDIGPKSDENRKMKKFETICIFSITIKYVLQQKSGLKSHFWISRLRSNFFFNAVTLTAGDVRGKSWRWGSIYKDILKFLCIIIMAPKAPKIWRKWTKNPLAQSGLKTLDPARSRMGRSPHIIRWVTKLRETSKNMTGWGSKTRV